MEKIGENSNSLSKEMKERIGQIAKHYGYSVRRLEDKCQVGHGNFSRATAILGFDKVAKIIDVYPEISATWLLTGRGEMLKQTSNDHSDASAITHVDELIRIIQTQAATLLEQQRFIDKHFGQDESRRVSPPRKFSEYPDNKLNKK